MKTFPPGAEGLQVDETTLANREFSPSFAHKNKCNVTTYLSYLPKYVMRTKNLNCSNLYVSAHDVKVCMYL